MPGYCNAPLLGLFVKLVVFFAPPNYRLGFAYKACKADKRVLKRGRVLAVAFAYARFFPESGAHRHAHAQRCIEAALLSVFIEFNRAYRAKRAVASGKLYCRIFAAWVGPYAVRQKIALNAHYYLYVNALFLKLVRRAHRRGERLHNAMIRYGYRLMSPLCGRFYRLRRVDKAIHSAHLCMQMQLHPLFLCLILSQHGFGFVYGIRKQAVCAAELVSLIAAMHNYPAARGLNLVESVNYLLFVCAWEQLYGQCVAFISNVALHYKPAVLPFAHIY